MKPKNKDRTIEGMRNLAKEHNGFCLSEKYHGLKTKLTWKCELGHVWETRPEVVVNGSWCPQCSKNKRLLTIQDMQFLAEKRDGKYLSTTYINISTQLTWQCAEGHIWQAQPNLIKNGSWCPECSNQVPLSIDFFQEKAKEKGGECLSTEFLTLKSTHLTLKCREGHIWETTANNYGGIHGALFVLNYLARVHLLKNIP